MKDKIFYILVGLMGIVSLCVIVPILLGGVKAFWDAENPINEFVDNNQEAINIVSDIGDFVSTNAVMKQGSDLLSELQKQAEQEAASDTTIPADTSIITDNNVISDREEGSVVRVVDGDTYIINIEGIETKVRLIGVDTPESVAPEGYYKDNTAEGIMVSDIVKSYLKEGDIVYIEYDVGRTDTYGRTLAYVYFNSGLMVQEWLLQNGYAQVMTVQPNSKYANHFVALEQEAMNSKIGLWRE